MPAANYNTGKDLFCTFFRFCNAFTVEWLLNHHSKHVTMQIYSNGLGSLLRITQCVEVIQKLVYFLCSAACQIAHVCVFEAPSVHRRDDLFRQDSICGYQIFMMQIIKNDVNTCKRLSTEHFGQFEGHEFLLFPHEVLFLLDAQNGLLDLGGSLVFLNIGAVRSIVFRSLNQPSINELKLSTRFWNPLYYKYAFKLVT